MQDFLLFKNEYYDILYLCEAYYNLNCCGRKIMVISYKKLWKLLIDKDMKKKDLQELAGISSASITKMAKNENINTETLQKVCNALKCDISDIVEMINE